MQTVKCARPNISNEEIVEVVKVLKSGNLVQGEWVRKFECSFAEYMGSDYAVAVNSGTAALHLALLGLGLEPGSKVAVPAMSFFATVSAVIMAGYTPFFIDVDERNYGMDADKLHQMLEKTDIKAVLAVHLYGIPASIETIRNLCIDYDIPLIEDCAQAHGSMVKGKNVGTFGHAGCFSFYATKHMTTIEGGMIITNDSGYADYYRRLRNHGLIGRNSHFAIGYNYRMNEVSAVLGYHQLMNLDKWNNARRQSTFKILDAISKFDWLEPYPYRGEDLNTYSTFFWAPVQIKNPEVISLWELYVELRDKGIEIRFRYDAPLYRQEAIYDLMPYLENLHLHTSEKIAPRIFGLPNRIDLAQKEIDRVVEVFEEITEKYFNCVRP